MNLNFLKKRNKFKISYLSWSIKILLVFAIIYSVYFHLWHLLFAHFLLLILSFMPYFIKKNYDIFIPREFEFLFLIFVGITFFLGGLKGWIIQLFFGTAMGFIGFGIMLILHSDTKLKKNNFIIIAFSLSFSLFLGLLAEILKYYLKNLLKYEIGISDYYFAMSNLTFVLLGSSVSSIIGYLYLKGYKPKIIKKLAIKFKDHNPNIFNKIINSPQEILELIKKGENEKLEFKSTLRVNLYTNEIDRKIEIASLKTIVAFLNSFGGILLIGVNDKGEIIGIEKDNFPSYDKLNLHFYNLLKEKIGNEFLQFIHFDLIKIENKTILKVECEKSNKPVFLKNEDKEEFYIRMGAASVEINGTKLINYISNRFN